MSHTVPAIFSLHTIALSPSNGFLGCWLIFKSGSLETTLQCTDMAIDFEASLKEVQAYLIWFFCVCLDRTRIQKQKKLLKMKCQRRRSWKMTLMKMMKMKQRKRRVYPTKRRRWRSFPFLCYEWNIYFLISISAYVSCVLDFSSSLCCEKDVDSDLFYWPFAAATSYEDCRA